MRKKDVPSQRGKITPKRTRLRDINIFHKKETDFISGVPQHFLGITDQQLGRLFENAWALIEIHEAGEAIQGFRLLCHLHPYVSDFWYGLGHALKEGGDASEALSAFIMAETIEPSCFDYYQEAIESAIEAGKKKEARRIFNRLMAHRRTVEGFNSRVKDVKRLEELFSNHTPQ